MQAVSGSIPSGGVGNIRIAKLHHVHLPMVRKNFETLQVDPYVKEGFRRKHIMRYLVVSRDPVIKLEPLPQEPLFQRKLYNPVHGDIPRVYPGFVPTSETFRVIQTFIHESSIEEGQRILVQAQRITCSLTHEGLPSVENWHQDDVNEIGIFCVTRYGILGGCNEFQDLEGRELATLTLQDGDFVMFKDAEVKHRVTPINPDVAKGNVYGYLDVLLLSHGGCT